MKTRTNQPVTTFDVEDLEVTHELKGFENIVDKDGHKRFVEGDIALYEVSGMTKTYGKWALSGAHLLIVLAGSIANGTALSYQTIAEVNLPSWIKDKIVPLYSTAVVRNQDTYFGSSGSDTQNNYSFLIKDETHIYINIGALTLSSNKTFRIAFDLLIDNE